MNNKAKFSIRLLTMVGVFCAMHVQAMDNKNQAVVIRGKLIVKLSGLYHLSTGYGDEKNKLEKIFGITIPENDLLIAVTIESDDLEKVRNTHPGFAQAKQYLKKFCGTGDAQKIADCEEVLVQGATRKFPAYWPTSLLKDKNKGDEVIATIYGLSAVFELSVAKMK